MTAQSSGDILSSFFKAYDMRGTSPVLNEQVYYLIGKAYAELILKAENLPLLVCLTHDARLTSPEFYKAMYHGLVESGVEVRPYGLASTDMMYAAVMMNGASGITITASHNPKEYNGTKIVRELPIMLGQEQGLGKIRDYVLAHSDTCTYKSGDYDAVPVGEESRLMEFFINKISTIGRSEHVTQTLTTENKRLKVVVDTSNAVAGVFIKQFVELYPNIEFIPLFWDIDGTMPNHEANPTIPANIETLASTVREQGADFGAAFDGDADRMVIVDENGEVIKGQYLAALMAEHYTQIANMGSNTEFNNAVVYAAAGGTLIPKTILANSAAAIPSNIGHAYIKKLMKDYNAYFGCEHTGHYYYGQFGYMDSGVLTLASFIDIYVSRGVRSCGDMYKHLTQKYWYITETNFRLTPELNKDAIIAIIQQAYPHAEFNYADGISVTDRNCFFNIRFSNNEPLLRLNLETIGSDQREQKVAEIVDIVGLHGLEV